MSDDLSGDMLAPSWPNLVVFWLVFTLTVRDLGDNINNVFSDSILLFLLQYTGILFMGVGGLPPFITLLI